MFWKQKPTPEFWRSVIIAIVIGFAAGALGALAIWSRMLAYETSLHLGNQPIPLGLTRRATSREREVAEALSTTSARSVVSFFEEKIGEDVRYLPEEAVGQGFVFTSDGWLISHRSSLDPRRRANTLAGIGPFLVSLDKIVEDTETGVLFVKVVQDRLDPVVFAQGTGGAGERVFAVIPPRGATLGWVKNPRARDSLFGSSDELVTTLVFKDPFPVDIAGGPIFNENQEVLGIAVGEAGTVRSAVPVAHIEPFFEDLLAGNLLKRPTLGVRGLSLADSRTMEGKRERGFLLARDLGSGARAVDTGSTASVAGLMAGDTIVKLNDTVLNGLVDLAETLLAFRPGEELDLTVVRNGDELVLPVTLGSREVGREY